MDDYGQRLATALAAVKQMHKDTAALLREVDRLAITDDAFPLHGWRPVHGTFITSNLSWEIKRGYYMAEGLYRHYMSKDGVKAGPTLVRALTIAFFNADGPVLREPMLIGTELLYNTNAPTNGKTLSVWDGWDAYFSNQKRATVGTRMELDRACLPPKLAHIEKGSLLARELYSITSQADIASFCRNAWEAKSNPQPPRAD